MSFLYLRTVSIARPNATTTAGVQPVQEFTAPQETILVTGLTCSIQIDRDGGAPLTGVPGQSRARGVWRIIIPKGVAAMAGFYTPSSIMDDDIAIDDVGLRYQITQAYYHSLGWSLRSERLEA